MLSCMRGLNILVINLLSVILFANIFSHLVCCLFTLSVLFFAMRKLLSLIRFHLFIFAFVSFALEVDPKNMSMVYVQEGSPCIFF